MDADGVLVRDPLAVTEAVFDPVDVCEPAKKSKTVRFA
jgi:hypothetical protein